MILKIKSVGGNILVLAKCGINSHTVKCKSDSILKCGGQGNCVFTERPKNINGIDVDLF